MGKERIVFEVDSDLIERLRAAGVDPQTYVQSIMGRKAAQLRSEEDEAALEHAWAEENRAAIAAYNEQVDRIGTFASRQRARRA